MAGCASELLVAVAAAAAATFLAASWWASRPWEEWERLRGPFSLSLCVMDVQ